MGAWAVLSLHPVRTSEVLGSLLYPLIKRHSWASGGFLHPGEEEVRDHLPLTPYPSGLLQSSALGSPPPSPPSPETDVPSSPSPPDSSPMDISLSGIPKRRTGKTRGVACPSASWPGCGPPWGLTYILPGAVVYLRVVVQSSAPAHSDYVA